MYDMDDTEPCGEGMCRCGCAGLQLHACGCDCPRDEDGRLLGHG